VQPLEHYANYSLEEAPAGLGENSQLTQPTYSLAHAGLQMLMQLTLLGHSPPTRVQLQVHPKLCMSVQDCKAV